MYLYRLKIIVNNVCQKNEMLIPEVTNESLICLVLALTFPDKSVTKMTVRKSTYTYADNDTVREIYNYILASDRNPVVLHVKKLNVNFGKSCPKL